MTDTSIVVLAAVQAATTAVLVIVTVYFQWTTHRLSIAQAMPHLIAELVGFRPDGLWVRTRNHGGGSAQGISFAACLVRGTIDVSSPTKDSPCDREDCVVSGGGTIGSLGVGRANERRLIAWDEAPPLEEIGEPWTLLVLFSFQGPDRKNRSNPHWIAFTRARLVEPVPIPPDPK